MEYHSAADNSGLGGRFEEKMLELQAPFQKIRDRLLAAMIGLNLFFGKRRMLPKTTGRSFGGKLGW
ncbi:hypothetical protein [Paenibacillus sp. FSL H7-0716]|uniref:hypothetical protein n=1 Tax=Paenibacillus sp. FSL H7-0716 TaxID=2921439 RepID=UPI0030F9BF6C